MSRRDVEYDFAKQMMSQIRALNEQKNDKPSEDNEDDAIAITNDPKFGDNVLRNQISAFKQSVHGGAKFADENTEDSKSNPLVYFPNTGNLVFSGNIPALSGLKFQFSLNDVTNAPYIFVDGLALTDESIKVLNKLSGYYKNWCDEWNAAGDLLDKLKNEN